MGGQGSQGCAPPSHGSRAVHELEADARGQSRVGDVVLEYVLDRRVEGCVVHPAGVQVREAARRQVDVIGPLRLDRHQRGTRIPREVPRGRAAGPQRQAQMVGADGEDLARAQERDRYVPVHRDGEELEGPAQGGLRIGAAEGGSERVGQLRPDRAGHLPSGGAVAVLGIIPAERARLRAPSAHFAP